MNDNHSMQSKRMSLAGYLSSNLTWVCWLTSLKIVFICFKKIEIVFLLIICHALRSRICCQSTLNCRKDPSIPKMSEYNFSEPGLFFSLDLCLYCFVSHELSFSILAINTSRVTTEKMYQNYIGFNILH